jgi:hypothetical protein
MKIKIKSKFIIFFFLLAVGMSLLAQCPFGNNTKINCIKGCGRFIDQNNDGFCDNGKVEQLSENKKDTANAGISNTQTQKDTNNSVELRMPTKSYTPKEQNQKTEIQQQNVQTQETENITNFTIIEPNEENMQSPVPYPIISISICVLLLYVFTMMLVKTGRIRKITHRKIWNIVLLISFLLSCCDGFYLVLQLNYQWTMSLFPLLLKIHVWAGMVMALIGFIHILWHLTYFKRMLKPNREKK